MAIFERTMPPEATVALARKRRRGPRPVRALLRNPLAVAGMLIVLGFSLVAVMAPVLAPPADPSRPFSMPRAGYQPEPQPPGPGHPFGTTQDQYDLYYGVIWGTRTAFLIGLTVTGLTLTIGVTLGAVAAYAGGWVDELMQRIVEVFMAFPFLIAALAMAALLAPKLHNPLLGALIALTLFGWTGYARLIRGDILSVKQRDYVLAARGMGARPRQIVLRHVLPNAILPVLVIAWLDIGGSVLAFAGLSFLGLGTEEGYADWGQLLALARNWTPALAQYWYILVFPGGALVLFSLGWNLVGDGFRDALDPHSQSGRG
ncbi:MAG TPA: ABC transporter permease [Chloroflexia bacterium]|nr:ABC transporter permease [Chloroflexia bacterium]